MKSKYPRLDYEFQVNLMDSDPEIGELMRDYARYSVSKDIVMGAGIIAEACKIKLKELLSDSDYRRYFKLD